MNTEYPYTVEKDEGGCLFVQFIDLEKAFTQGETLEEARFNAAEVLSAMLAYRLTKNQDIPTPSKCPINGFMISPDPEVQASGLVIKKREGKQAII